jgi:hypothetical protein
MLIADVHQYVVALNPERIDGDFHILIVDGRPGFGIVLPAVPGTNDLPLFDDSLSEWSTAMNAYIVHGGVLTGYVGDAHHFVAKRKLPGLTLGGKLSFSGNSGRRHVIPSLCFTLRAPARDT